MNFESEAEATKILPLIENGHLLDALQQRDNFIQSTIAKTMSELGDIDLLSSVLENILPHKIPDSYGGDIATNALKKFYKKSRYEFLVRLHDFFKKQSEGKFDDTMISKVLENSKIDNDLLECLSGNKKIGINILLLLDDKNEKWRKSACDYIRNISGIIEYKIFLTEFLEIRGILVFGNLLCQDERRNEKPFNPDKVLIVNEKGDIKERLVSVMPTEKHDPRNRIVASLGFFLSCMEAVTIQKQMTHIKKPKYISIPIKVGNDGFFNIEKVHPFLKCERIKKKENIENKDSEAALCHALYLNKEGVLDKIHKELEQEIKKNNLLILKLKVLVLEIYSDYNACDHCRVLLANQLLIAAAYLRQILNHAFNYNTPKRSDLYEKKDKGIGISILYFYKTQLKDSPTTGHTYKEKNAFSPIEIRRRAFYSNGLFLPVKIDNDAGSDMKLAYNCILISPSFPEKLETDVLYLMVYKSKKRITVDAINIKSPKDISEREYSDIERTLKGKKLDFDKLPIKITDLTLIKEITSICSLSLTDYTVFFSNG